jgi:hypothetical protein
MMRPLSSQTLNTSVKSVTDFTTPLAQTRQEAEAEALESARRRRPTSSANGLEGRTHVFRSNRHRLMSSDIPESHAWESSEPPTEDEYQTDASYDDDNTLHMQHATLHTDTDEIEALNSALQECWTLCNTLAGMSAHHRQRIFKFAGTGDIQEQAWRTCWKLCQKLYNSRDEDPSDEEVTPTLDLCREFCAALFEVRERDNEVSDSVLRVSFELNNHLYNTHDRTLPDAFRERTLDFYITLCHRLMKQRSGLAEETDSLLRACWGLAEMLFSLRQNRHDGKEPDDALLGSAVQACWELCDLFREGWTQVRPDRGTPRPSQTTFQLPMQPVKSDRDRDTEDRSDYVPPTPTTIDDDVALSPDDGPAPNIMVMAPEGNRSRQWSSNSSMRSGYSSKSKGSQGTSSTATTTAGEDVNLTRFKILIVKAAMISGFERNTSMSLSTYVKSLSTNAFGNAPWQVSLLDNYRKLVTTQPVLRAPVNLPPRRATATEIARSCIWMMRSGKHNWLRDLYRMVFGFQLEEAEMRAGVVIQT